MSPLNIIIGVGLVVPSIIVVILTIAYMRLQAKFKERFEGKKYIKALLANYLENVMAYCSRSNINGQPPNERLMRGIETKICIPEQGCDDFRRMIASFIGQLAFEGKQFKWNSNPELAKALKLRLADYILEGE